MSKYEIHRWDLVMTGNSTIKTPIIYIKPDLDFLEFARENNFSVVALIKGTGLQYDGKQIPAIVNKGCSFPNCLPNLSDATGYYVINLDTKSYGYPKDGKLGTVSFLGLVKPSDSVVVDKKKNVVDKKKKESSKGMRSLKNNGFSNLCSLKNEIFFGILIFTLIVLLFMLSKNLCN